MPKGKSSSDCKNRNDSLIVPYSNSKGYDVDTVTKFYSQGDKPYCVRYCLSSVFSFKGLHRPEKYLMSCSSDQDYCLVRLVQLLQKEGGNYNK